MNANWVKESCSTTGTGATVTLGGAAAGFVTFAAAHSIGEVIPYAFEDGNNREVGLGTLLSSSSFSRDYVLEKLESGVLTRNPATPLSLSGSAIIACALIGQQTGGGGYVAPSTNSTLSGKRMMSAIPAIPTLSTLAVAADVLHLSPFRLDAPLVLNALCSYLQTGVASTAAYLGLYEQKADGMPGALLASTASQATTSSGVLIRGTVTQIYIPAGLYWFANLANGAITWRTRAGGWSCFGGTNSNIQTALTRLTVANTYASGLPATAPTSGYTVVDSASSGNILSALEGV